MKGFLERFLVFVLEDFFYLWITPSTITNLSYQTDKICKSLKKKWEGEEGKIPVCQKFFHSIDHHRYLLTLQNPNSLQNANELDYFPATLITELLRKQADQITENIWNLYPPPSMKLIL